MALDALEQSLAALYEAQRVVRGRQIKVRLGGKDYPALQNDTEIDAQPIDGAEEDITEVTVAIQASLHPKEPKGTIIIDGRERDILSATKTNGIAWIIVAGSSAGE